MTALLVVAVVIGVRIVGAILMVAMLVVPTVTARQLADRFPPRAGSAGLVGAAVGVVGASGGHPRPAPDGPGVVLTGFAVAVAALLFAPGRGVLWRARKRLAARRRAVRRDAVLVEPGAPVDRAAATGSPGPGCAAAACCAADGRTLTPAGQAAAADLADRRALWTAWLAHGASVELPDAREPDPADLPGSLGADAVAQLRALANGGSRA